MTTDTDRVTLETVTGPDATADADGWEHYAYTVRLTRGAVSIEVPWKQGVAITDDPTAARVLECLILDASGYENAADFEDWATGYGMDTDSRSAEATYRAVEEQTAKLRELLGDDFDAAVSPPYDPDDNDPPWTAARKLAADPEEA